MRVLLPRGTSQRTSSTGTRARLASGLLPGCGWPRAYCRGVAGLGGAGARPPAGLMPSSVVLGHTVGAWVPVGLLSGLVVIHPVRERRSCCRR